MMRSAFYIRGVTLFEVLVAGALAVLIGGSIAFFNLDIFSLSGIFQDSLSTQTEGRKLLRTMTAEIRSAAPADNGSYPIAMASTTEFSFYSDADNDGKHERVRYFLEGNTVKRGVIIPSGNPAVYAEGSESVTVILRGVVSSTTPTFLYYDASYDGTGDPLSAPPTISAIRLVRITFVADRDPSEPPAPFTLTTQVSIRNLKENL